MARMAETGGTLIVVVTVVVIAVIVVVVVHLGNVLKSKSCSDSVYSATNCRGHSTGFSG